MTGAQRRSLPGFIKDCNTEKLSLAESGLLFIAIQFAICRHWMQKRADQVTEYYEHLLIVAESLAKYGFELAVQIAGLLHDVLEDCNASLEEIKEKFGSKVADLVFYLTKDPDNPEGYFDQLYEGTQIYFEVIFIKMFDRLHNLLTVYCFRDRERQERFLIETLGPFADLMDRCRKLIPDEWLPLYDEVRSTILEKAQELLDELLSGKVE